MNNGAANIFIGQDVSPNASPQESMIAGSGIANTFIGKDAGRIATNATQYVAVGLNVAKAMTTEDFGLYVGAFAGSVAAADGAVLAGITLLFFVYRKLLQAIQSYRSDAPAQFR